MPEALVTREQILAAYRTDAPELAGVPDDQLARAIAADEPDFAKTVLAPMPAESFDPQTGRYYRGAVESPELTAQRNREQAARRLAQAEAGVGASAGPKVLSAGPGFAAGGAGFPAAAPTTRPVPRPAPATGGAPLTHEQQTNPAVGHDHERTLRAYSRVGEQIGQLDRWWRTRTNDERTALRGQMMRDLLPGADHPLTPGLVAAAQRGAARPYDRGGRTTAGSMIVANMEGLHHVATAAEEAINRAGTPIYVPDAEGNAARRQRMVDEAKAHFGVRPEDEQTFGYQMTAATAQALPTLAALGPLQLPARIGVGARTALTGLGLVRGPATAAAAAGIQGAAATAAGIAEWQLGGVLPQALAEGDRGLVADALVQSVRDLADAGAKLASGRAAEVTPGQWVNLAFYVWGGGSGLYRGVRGVRFDRQQMDMLEARTRYSAVEMADYVEQAARHTNNPGLIGRLRSRLRESAADAVKRTRSRFGKPAADFDQRLADIVDQELAAAEARVTGRSSATPTTEGGPRAAEPTPPPEVQPPGQRPPGPVEPPAGTGDAGEPGGGRGGPPPDRPAAGPVRPVGPAAQAPRPGEAVTPPEPVGADQAPRPGEAEAAAQGVEEPPAPTTEEPPAPRPKGGQGAGPSQTPPRPGVSSAGAGDKPHDYSTTQVDLPEAVARRVRQAASRIDGADLTGDGRERTPHITVKYGLHTGDAAEVRRVLAGEPPVTVTLGTTSLFKNDDADVVKVDVDSPGLHRLNAKIAAALKTTDTHPTYEPHVTLAYVKPGRGARYAGDDSLAGQTVTLDTIAFSDRSGNVTQIKLGGRADDPGLAQLEAAVRAGGANPDKIRRRIARLSPEAAVARYKTDAVIRPFVEALVGTTDTQEPFHAPLQNPQQEPFHAPLQNPQADAPAPESAPPREGEGAAPPVRGTAGPAEGQGRGRREGVRRAERPVAARPAALTLRRVSPHAYAISGDTAGRQDQLLAAGARYRRGLEQWVVHPSKVDVFRESIPASVVEAPPRPSAPPRLGPEPAAEPKPALAPASLHELADRLITLDDEVRPADEPADAWRRASSALKADAAIEALAPGTGGEPARRGGATRRAQIDLVRLRLRQAGFGGPAPLRDLVDARRAELAQALAPGTPGTPGTPRERTMAAEATHHGGPHAPSEEAAAAAAAPADDAGRRRPGRSAGEGAAGGAAGGPGLSAAQRRVVERAVVNDKLPRAFGRAAIERQLLASAEGIPIDPKDLAEGMQETGVVEEFVGEMRFGGPIPSDVLLAFEGREVQLRKIVKGNDPDGHAEDFIGSLDDAYGDGLGVFVQMVESLIGGRAGLVRRTMDFYEANAPAFPAEAFLVHYLNGMPRAVERPRQVLIDPAKLPEGTTLTINEEAFEVAASEGGQDMRLVSLESGAADFPIMALQRVPVDAASVTPPAEADDQQGPSAQPVRGEAGPGTGPGAAPRRQRVRVPDPAKAMRDAGESALQPPRAAPPSSDEPTTRAGRKLVAAIRRDVRGRKVGVRSIVRMLGDALGVEHRIGREQVTRASPAHYVADGFHLVRSTTEAAAWMFHEDAHGLAALVQERFPLFLRGRGDPLSLGDRLVKITLRPDSMASERTPAEGFAEWVRFYVTDPVSLPREVTHRVEAFLHEHFPRHLATLRDARLAWEAHLARDPDARDASYRHDRLPKAGWRELTGHGRDWLMFSMASASSALDQRLLKPAFDVVMRRSVRAGKRLDELTFDTPADPQNAHTMTLLAPALVGRAMYGGRHGPKGVTILQFGPRPFEDLLDQLEPGQRTEAAAAFDLDKLKGGAGGGRHGELLELTDFSVADVVEAVKSGDRGNPNAWEDFENYAWRTLALYRWQNHGVRYAGILDDQPPHVMRAQIQKAEAAHPTWRGELDRLTRLMNQTLLLPVLTGELTLPQAVHIVKTQGTFLPVRVHAGTQVQAEQKPAVGGAGASPSAGIQRIGGGDRPYEGSLLDAVERAIKRRYDAYAHQNVMTAVWNFTQAAGRLEGVPLEARAAVQRLLVPLALDMKLIASLESEGDYDEIRRVIADYLNGQTARELGTTPDKLPPEAQIGPEDVALAFPQTADVWRPVRPQAVNVIAPFVPGTGQRRFIQVGDPILYRYFARARQPHRAWKALTDLVAGVEQPLRRLATRNHVFALKNFLTRDSATAQMLGESALPFSQAVTGLLTRLKGDPELAAAAAFAGELYSRFAQDMNSARQRSRVDSFKAALAEGIVQPDWADLNVAEMLARSPGVVASTLAKPLDLGLWALGGPKSAEASELLNRLGAFDAARRRGLSTAKAVEQMQRVTGYFSERAGSPAAAAFWRTTAFFNAGVQVLMQTYQRATDPRPRAGAALLGGGGRARHRAGSAFAFAARLGAIAATWALYRLMQELYLDDDDRAQLAERTEEDMVTNTFFKDPVSGVLIRLPHDYGPAGMAQAVGELAVDRYLAVRRRVEGGPSSKQLAWNLLTRAAALPEWQALLTGPGEEALQLYTNRDFYFQREVVPGWLEDQFPLHPEYRHFDNTPASYTWLAGKLRVSPLQVQHVTRSRFGNVMDDALTAIDQAVQGRPPQELDQVPYIGRLFLREPRGWRARSVEDLSDLDRAYRSAKSVADYLIEHGAAADEPRLQEVRRTIDALTDVHVAFNRMSKLWDRRRALGPDRAEVHADVAALEREMLSLAQRALKAHRRRNQDEPPTSDAKE